MLSLENFSIGHNKVPLILDFTAQVLPGEAIGMIGLNGVGKTTMLESISGFKKPLNGNCYYGNQLINELCAADRAQIFSYLFSKNEINLELTGFEVLKFSSLPLNVFSSHLEEETIKKIEKITKLFKLDDFIDQKIAHISDGQRQKILLARAFMHDGPIIFLDEPTIYLDLYFKADIVSIINRIKKEMNKIVIFVSHDEKFLDSVADKFWLFDSKSNKVHVSDKKYAELDLY